MKHITRIFMLYIVGVLVLSNVLTVQAGRGRPVTATGANFAWFDTVGLIATPTLPQGFVYAAELPFTHFQSSGAYVISGNAFVGQVPSLTRVSGTCSIKHEPPMRFHATIEIDGNGYAVPLFDTQDDVAPFNLALRGQSFVITVYTVTPVACNVMLEAIG